METNADGMAVGLRRGRRLGWERQFRLPISSTTGISRAFGSEFGLAVYSPSTSVSRNSHSADMSAATCERRQSHLKEEALRPVYWVARPSLRVITTHTWALSESLSPILSSSTATVSFSFTIGMTPIENSAAKVLRAWKVAVGFVSEESEGCH